MGMLSKPVIERNFLIKFPMHQFRINLKDQARDAACTIKLKNSTDVTSRQFDNLRDL